MQNLNVSRISADYTPFCGFPSAFFHERTTIPSKSAPDRRNGAPMDLVSARVARRLQFGRGKGAANDAQRAEARPFAFLRFVRFLLLQPFFYYKFDYKGIIYISNIYFITMGVAIRHTANRVNAYTAI